MYKIQTLPVCFLVLITPVKMKELVIFLLLKLGSAFEDYDTSKHKSVNNNLPIQGISSFWPSQTVSHTQTPPYPLKLPSTEDLAYKLQYVKTTEPHKSMTQTVFLPTSTVLHNTQQQLLSSVQALHPGFQLNYQLPYPNTFYRNLVGQGVPQNTSLSMSSPFIGTVPAFQTYYPIYQLPYSNTVYKFVNEQQNPQNVSASELKSINGAFPSFQNYYPSSFGLISASVNPAPSFSPSGGKVASSNAELHNSLTPYVAQGSVRNQYFNPGITSPTYSQVLPLQQGLAIPHNNLYSFNQIQRQNGGNPASSQYPSPVRMKMHQYSAKHLVPQNEHTKEGSGIRNKGKEKDKKEDENGFHNTEENYRLSYMSQGSKFEDNKDESKPHISTNSFQFAEYKKVPKLSQPLNEEYESKESSSFEDIDHFSKTSPSASNNKYSEFIDDHDGLGINSFVEQFKNFPTNENFKDPVFSADMSNEKKVTQYYKKHQTLEKPLKMIVVKHESKFTDNYKSPEHHKPTETPVTFYSYPYKSPKYSYKESVEYFPHQIKNLPKTAGISMMRITSLPASSINSKY